MKLLVCLCILLFVSISLAAPIDDDQWSQFKSQFGKVYNVTESERYVIFKKRVAYIDQHNGKDATYKMAINRFADWVSQWKF